MLGKHKYYSKEMTFQDFGVSPFQFSSERVIPLVEQLHFFSLHLDVWHQNDWILQTQQLTTCHDAIVFVVFGAPHADAIGLQIILAGPMVTACHCQECTVTRFEGHPSYKTTNKSTQFEHWNIWKYLKWTLTWFKHTEMTRPLGGKAITGRPRAPWLHAPPALSSLKDAPSSTLRGDLGASENLTAIN